MRNKKAQELMLGKTARLVLSIIAIAGLSYLILVNWLPGITKYIVDTPLDYEDQLAESKQQEQHFITLANEGKLYAQQHNYDSAATKYQELINSPGSDNIVDTQRYYIAKSFFETNKYDEAMLHYRLFIQKKPNAQQQMIDTAYSDLTSIYIKKGMSEEANELVKEYKQNYPDSNYYAQLSIKLTG
ncbi:tetratricopeptide repeat protein [Candidatus Woesearchaeota archaeon]|jgi:tetratricopeptide (TPR) repeat protein|nr:tetratricopeptide repeat protein [Candidatus Woesearchaeota archaeon]